MRILLAPIAPIRSGSIDALRHLLCVAVIIQHMTSKARYSPELNEAITRFASHIDGAVMGFFLLSGLFSSIGSGQGWQAGLRRQLTRLLPPFVLFSLLNGAALSMLGKADPAVELIRLLTLQGSGPQLYFLPYLLLVWIFWRAGAAAWAVLKVPMAVAVPLLILALLAAAFALPTRLSTGPAPPLLLLYAAAYGIGLAAQATFRRGGAVALPLAALGVVLAGGGFADARFFDLAGMVTAAALAVELHRRGVLRGTSLPGSGGVYLLHTPITNHALSTLLLGFGVAAAANVIWTVVLTYGLCLAVTLTLIHRWPRVRPLLLE